MDGSMRVTGSCDHELSILVDLAQPAATVSPNNVRPYSLCGDPYYIKTPLSAQPL